MSEVLVFLEPWPKPDPGSLLGLVGKAREFFEFRIWVLPRVKSISSMHKTKVFSSDVMVNDYLAKHGISVIAEEEIVKEKLESGIQNSVKLAQEWYKYRKLEELLTSNDVNLAEALEQEVADLLFRIFNEIESVRAILNKETAELVYVENLHSPRGQIIHSIATAKGIECLSLLPALYGKFKSRTISYISSKRYISQVIRPVHLYWIPSGANKTNSSGTIFVDAPHLPCLDVIFPVLSKHLVNGNKVYLQGKASHISNHTTRFTQVPLRTGKEKRRWNDLRQVLTEQAFHELFNYNGINFWSAVKWNFHYLLHDRLIAVAQQLKWFDQVILQIKPNIVLVGACTMPSFVRAHVLLAKNKGIPVVEIQHGMYTPATPRATPLCDRICVWGDYAKEVLKSAGATDDQIIVTGSPKYDLLLEKIKEYSHRGMLRRQKRLLLVTGGPYEDIYLRVIRELGSFLKTRDDILLVVKPHPAESGELYKSIAREFHPRVTVEKPTEDIQNLLLKADVLITISSTVGIDAAIANKPIILLKTTNIGEIPYQHISMEVQRAEEIASVVKNLADRNDRQDEVLEAREKFVYEHAYIQDGQASKRVADLIIQMIEDSKKDKVVSRE